MEMRTSRTVGRQVGVPDEAWRRSDWEFPRRDGEDEGTFFVFFP